MKVSICYEITRTYYHNEVIEAENLVEAERIGRKLLDSASFDWMLDDCGEYEGHSTAFDSVIGTDDDVTLTQSEIDGYMKEV